MRRGPAWWRFVPGGTPDADELRAAAGQGRGAFSRALRDMRASLGAARAAMLLQKAFPDEADLPGLAVRLLLVTSYQPAAILDAMTLAFLIAGLRVEIEPVEGVAAATELAARTGGEKPSRPFDLAILSVGGGEAGEAGGEALARLAVSLAERIGAPAAVAEFETSAGSRAVAAPATGQPGARRIAIPLAALGGEAPFDQRFAASFGTIPTAAGADAISDAAAAFAAQVKGIAPKILVTDLDGTLWRGVAGEGELAGGEAGEALAPGAIEANIPYAEALSELGRRGLVLAFASRNDQETVEPAFARLYERSILPAERFAARAIGWEDKASLVGQALDAVGLAPEHAVFVDDDPVNCAAVALRFPAMDVRLFEGDGEAFAAALLADPLLTAAQGGSGERGEHYRRKAEVDRLRSTEADFGAFLDKLGTRLLVRPLVPALVPRAAELARRVNQFVFTSYRPNELELVARRSPLDFMVGLEDAFGSHGLVGLVLADVEEEEARIANLFLSCRALQRGVEAAMLSVLARLAGERGLAGIAGHVETLPRNLPARDCLSSNGFGRRGSDWVRHLSAAGLPALPRGITVEFATNERVAGS